MASGTCAALRTAQAARVHPALDIGPFLRRSPAKGQRLECWTGASDATSTTPTRRRAYEAPAPNCRGSMHDVDTQPRPATALLAVLGARRS